MKEMTKWLPTSHSLIYTLSHLSSRSGEPPSLGEIRVRHGQFSMIILLRALVGLSLV